MASSSSLDYHILTLSRLAGQDQTALPGLYLAPRPRRFARGRADDRLILYLELTGATPLPEDKTSLLFQDLAHTYYQSPGTISSALRSVAETLNDFLLARLPADARASQHTVGRLAQVVLRQDICYLAQSGEVHAYTIQASGSQYLYDPALSGRGLGLGKSFGLRFSQFALHPGEALLLAFTPADSWSIRNLERLYGQGPETMRRRLSDRYAMNLNAVLVYAHRGTGQVQVISAARPAQPLPASITASSAAVKPSPDVPAPASGLPGPSQAPGEYSPSTPASVPLSTPVQSSETGQPEGTTYPASQALPPVSIAPPQSTPIAPAETPPTSSTPAASPQPPLQPPTPREPPLPPAPSKGESGQGVPATSAPPSPGVTSPKPAAPSAPRKTAFLAMLVAVGEAFSTVLQKMARAIGRFLLRLFPEEVLKIPNSVMAVIAIVIPLIVVTAAGVAYSRLGKGVQGRELFAQANEQARQALQQTDVLAKRTGLQNALDILDASIAYGGVLASERDELRQTIQSELDRLDEVRRIDYRSAIIGGLPSEVLITHLVPVFNDLYLLDFNAGSILRAEKTPQGYKVDLDFKCGPAYTSQNIDKLIDMVAWPAGYKPTASIVGVDPNGNLLFCQPGQPPVVSALKPSAVSGLHKISAITMDRGHLYALDIPANSVWFYAGGDFEREPNFLFAEQVPAMDQVVDLAVNFDQVYLLKSDGSLTVCYTNVMSLSVPRCIENQPLVDFRQGRENLPFTPSHPFTQISVKPAPDPSLYILVGEEQSINRFTFGELGFLRDLHPRELLPGGPATAFAVSDLDQIVYLAVGNRVFYGNLP